MKQDDDDDTIGDVANVCGELTVNNEKAFTLWTTWVMNKRFMIRFMIILYLLFFDFEIIIIDKWIDRILSLESNKKYNLMVMVYAK